MKHVFLTASLLLATLAVLPSASADAADAAEAAWVPCPQQPGYQACTFQTEDCHGDVRYYQHDSFYTYSAECQFGNLNCSYYSHSLYGHQEGYNCHIVDEAAAAAASDAPADAVAAPCQPQPGYRDCTVSALGCTVGVRYYQHDGLFEPVAQCSTATAAAEPVDCHGPLDGYQYCEVESGDCHAGDTYMAGYGLDAHAECQPTDGKSRCGVDAHAPELAADYHCMGREGQLLPLGINAAAAPPCDVDQDVYPGHYFNVDVDCDPLLNCHLNSIEDSTRTCVSDTAACAEEALGVELGTQYTEDGCHDDACASLRGLVTDPKRCVVPEGVAGSLPATAAGASSAGGCQQYPGYERCDYVVGPCTVTTYYYFHDAFYRVDGPNCDKPRLTASAAADGCQQYPGYERCEYGAKPCTVTTTHYYHDARTVVEVCGLVRIDPSGGAAASSASADGTACEEHPGYRQCDYAAGPCTVTLYYFYHDAFYAIDGPNCDKPTVRSCEDHPGYEQCDYTAGPCTVTVYYVYHDARFVVGEPTCQKSTATASSAAPAAQPLDCQGLDGRLSCEVVAGPCHAGFYYQSPEVEDVHAQCFS